MGCSLLQLPSPPPKRTAVDSLAKGWGGRIHHSMLCWKSKTDVLWYAASSSFSSFFYAWVYCSHGGKKDLSAAVVSVDGGERWGLWAVCEVGEGRIRLVSFCFNGSRAI
jgi:hypothetical protein